MSMNMSPNLFDRSAIDFEELEYTPADTNQQLPLGWTWACDSHGSYISCSPETGKILGIASEDFSGEALANFALAPTSITDLQETLEAGDFPIEMRLDYLHADGSLIPVSMHITPRYSHTGTQDGWHGFALVLHTEESPPAQPEIATTQPKLHQVASAMILDTLDSLQKASSAIKEFPKSSVTVNELRIPSHNGVSSAGQFYSGAEYTPAGSPIVVEHKLKWGHKFDLDYEEDLFIRRRKFSERGLRGTLERLSAPKKFLKCDMRWFAVNLRVDRNCAQVWVDHPRAGKEPEKIELSEYLADPDILWPEIENALVNPWEAIITYRLGIDYLIDPDAEYDRKQVDPEGKNRGKV